MTLIINKIFKQLVLAAIILFFHKVTWGQPKLTLEQFRMLAIERNNKLKAAQENINEAHAIKLQQDAGGKPVIDLGVTGFYFGSPLNTVLPEYGAGPVVSVRQPIYSGGRIRLYKASASKGLEIQEEQKVFTTTEVLYNT